MPGPVIPKSTKPLLPEYDKWPEWVKNLIESKDPSMEPLAPKATEEPTTWMGGAAKSLYNDYVQPLSSLGMMAGMISGEGEGTLIPKGLSKSAFAEFIMGHPEAVETLEKSVIKTPQEVAELFAKEKGFPPPAAHTPVKVNKAFASKVADAYDNLKHNPTDPAVQKAYGALKGEISDQFQFITKEGGLKAEPWAQKGQPYADSKAMMQDITENNHLYYFPTEEGFGAGENALDHPMMERGKSGLLANDELRIVHDYLAHAKGGHSFGPNGEENAFLEHAKLLSPEAQKALATETRGQNSWVNFGAHLKDKDLPMSQRPFAPQKAGLLPEEFQTLAPERRVVEKSYVGKDKRVPQVSDTRMQELLSKFGGLKEEMLDLEHRTPKSDLLEIDPAFFGSGQAGAEKSRMSDPNFKPRSYTTIKGQPVEARFKKLPTLNAQVPKSSVYFMQEDPLGLIKRAQELAGPDQAAARTLFELLATQRGFKGYSDGTTVAYFDKIPISR